MLKKIISSLFLMLSFLLVQGQANYFYPNKGNFDASIPTPEQFLGYAIGEQHTRHDRIVAYLKELDRLSDKVSFEIIGETFEHRAQVVAIFSSPENHKNIEQIRLQHLSNQTNGTNNKVPLVIHLAYNVHGNEPSSSEAALLTAYYLTASQSEQTKEWLNNMIITLDPVINPDGRDRHTHWANMHKGTPAVADPNDREHNEIWPGGRFNHYWFDLNRDWFLGTFPETRNRINFFHKWRPYVQTDHHEMGTNSTFYFDPGKESSNNPIVPDYLYKNIYPKFGEYFTKATNSIGSMYFTKEAFDKLYPGYGSSYINFYGGAGFLFEQGSSRGHVQETTTIPISFGFTIRNQFTASLATITASLAEKESLIELRKQFYLTAKQQAASSNIKGYSFGDPNDFNRTKAFIDLLLLHKIDIYKVPNSTNYFVPTAQDNYIMVKSIFENQITYKDSTFYDASTWSLIHAYGLPFTEVKSSMILSEKINTPLVFNNTPIVKSNYAYLVNNTDYNIHQFIYALQNEGVFVQTATRTFSTNINGENMNFGYGSIVISVQQQKVDADMLYNIISKASVAANIKVHTVASGFNSSGIDLGSNYVKTLKKPEAAMIIGSGVAASEAGEIWHLLDQRLHMPITKIDILNFSRVRLERYNTLVMVSGAYNFLDKNSVDKIKAWVQNGNTLITIKSGAEWAIKNGFTKFKLAVDSSTTKGRLDYDRASDMEGAKALGGSIFSIDLDTTHPIGYGFSKRKVSVYKNNSTFFQNSTNAYSTIAQYTNTPLVGGYLHPNSLKMIKNSPSILVGAEGSGRVILFADEPNFRGTWYGTNKLFLNALFLGNIMTAPGADYSEEEDKH
ncbi:MAG: zinc carboxypeptidase [Chitinophagaceae bacterium]|nr:zinc carboxypeptidase [Chitinophagaceae bacterium]